MRNIIIVLSILAFTQCGTLKKKPVATVIEFEKTPCSGFCLTYKVEIKNNGEVYWNGIANVERLGLYRSNLTQEQLNDILAAFDEISFFELQDSYKSFMMDLPTTFVGYTKNGHTKRIKAYDNIPDDLQALIKQVEVLLESLSWVKVDE